MRNELITLPIIAFAGVFGSGTFPFSAEKPAKEFNYSAASPQERQSYLTTLGRELTDKFSPSFIAKDGTFKTGGRSITLSYNMRMSTIECDTDHSCRVMQCKRYLELPVSTNNISVRLRYLNARGQQIGTQLLKNSSCKATLKTWRAKHGIGL